MVVHLSISMLIKQFNGNLVPSHETAERIFPTALRETLARVAFLLASEPLGGLDIVDYTDKLVDIKSYLYRATGSEFESKS